MPLALIVDIIGWAGAIVFLVSYALVSAGRLDAQGYWYQGANLLGAVLLTINTLWHGALPSVALNLFWGAVAIATLARHVRRT